MGTKKRSAPMTPADLIRELSEIDGGDWTRETITRALEPLGWERDGDTLARKSGEVATFMDERFRDEKKLVGLRVPLPGAPPDMKQWIEAGKEALGWAPVMMGGPGPFVVWRRAGSSLAAPGTSVGLRNVEGTLVVELLATLRAEDAAYRVFEWGEGIDGLPYLWLGVRHDAAIGGLTTSGRLVYAWDTVEQALARLLTCFRDDLGALGGYGLAFKIALKPRDRSRREVAAVVFADGELDVFTDLPSKKFRLEDSEMAKLGWQKWVRNRWRFDYDARTDEEYREAARLMRATLEAWKVELPKSNMPERGVLGYVSSWMYGRVKGQKELVALLPLRDIDYAGCGVQRW